MTGTEVTRDGPTYTATYKEPYTPAIPNIPQLALYEVFFLIPLTLYAALYEGSLYFGYAVREELIEVSYAITLNR